MDDEPGHNLIGSLGQGELGMSAIENVQRRAQGKKDTRGGQSDEEVDPQAVGRLRFIACRQIALDDGLIGTVRNQIHEKQDDDHHPGYHLGRIPAGQEDGELLLCPGN